MITRRSLFKKLFALAATVAIAPQIAFAARSLEFEFQHGDDDYSCVMSEPIKEYTLYSETFVCENPERLLVIENFSA